MTDATDGGPTTSDMADAADAKPTTTKTSKILKQLIRPTMQNTHQHQPQQHHQMTKRKGLEQQIVALQASVHEVEDGGVQPAKKAAAEILNSSQR
jgi:soluble cytochrome b562